MYFRTLPIEWQPSAHTNIDGLVQHCSIAIGNALEILQFYTMPSICVISSDCRWGVANPETGTLYQCLLLSSLYHFTWFLCTSITLVATGERMSAVLYPILHRTQNTRARAWKVCGSHILYWCHMSIASQIYGYFVRIYSFHKGSVI